MLVLDHLKALCYKDASLYGCMPEFPYTYTLLPEKYYNGQRVDFIEVYEWDALLLGRLRDGCPCVTRLSEMTTEEITNTFKL